MTLPVNAKRRTFLLLGQKGTSNREDPPSGSFPKESAANRSPGSDAFSTAAGGTLASSLVFRQTGQARCYTGKAGVLPHLEPGEQPPTETSGLLS